MKNKITKIVLGLFVAIFAVGSFLPVGLASGNNGQASGGQGSAPDPCVIDANSTQCKFKMSIEKSARADSGTGKVMSFVIDVL